MQIFDALFVVNQNTSYKVIERYCSSLGASSILVLSTNMFFEYEKKIISSSVLAEELVFLTFAECLTDREMEDCDIAACQDASLRDFFYPDVFFLKSKYIKNSKVFNKLNKKFSFRNIFFDEGLGVDSDFWSSQKNAISICKSGNIFFGVSCVFDFFYRFRSLLSCEKFYLIRGANELFVFLSDVNRLDIKEEIEIEEVRFSALELFWAKIYRRRSYREVLIRRIHNKKNLEVATTIHGFDKGMVSPLYNLRIFSDGYHPPNYPRSYLDSFSSGSLIARDMYDAQWFEKGRSQVLKPYFFMRKRFFSKAKSDRALKRIFLMLNHAGDWSSIINRSDTDVLIEKFCGIDIQDRQFFIRPHPTMANTMHEGENSIERIKNLVSVLNRKNLFVSDYKSISDDIERADIIVSEYSNVILDGLKLGKICIIANFTKRRNLMQVYTDLGFLTATTQDELKNILMGLAHVPDRFIEKQNEAVSRYNTELKSFYDD